MLIKQPNSLKIAKQFYEPVGQANQDSSGKPSALFPGPDMVMVQKLDLSRDDLLVAMAVALEITLRKASRMWPEDGQGDVIATVLRDKRILFEGAR